MHLSSTQDLSPQYCLSDYIAEPNWTYNNGAKCGLLRPTVVCVAALGLTRGSSRYHRVNFCRVRNMLCSRWDGIQGSGRSQLAIALPTLGPMSPNFLSQKYPNSLCGPSHASKFHADSTTSSTRRIPGISKLPTPLKTQKNCLRRRSGKRILEPWEG